MGWACFQTYGAQERKAVENLARQGLESFSPFYIRPVPPSGKIRGPKELPLFPCYGFVLLEEPEQWGKPNNTYGVIRLLTDRNKVSPKPLWVPDSYISSLYNLQAKPANPLFPINTIVRVRTKDNPMYDLNGVVVSMSKNDRVKLLMSLFRRDVVIEFSTGDLEIVKS